MRPRTRRGWAAGIGAIKALRMAGYRGRIVATDSDPLAPGLRLADVGAVLPPAASEDFVPRALDLVRTWRIEAILPTSGFDTPVYARCASEFAAAGSPPDVMETCLDKGASTSAYTTTSRSLGASARRPATSSSHAW